jgi:outer membrane lipoprotein carrier protein
MQYLYKIVIFLVAVCGYSSWANGLNDLEFFLKEVKSGTAQFTQRVTAPAKEGQAPRVKTSSGSFAFARPDRFRFDYAKPFEQTIVADGQNLWLHDLDLNQVTQPAALIIHASSLEALRTQYTLTDVSDADGLKDGTKDGAKGDLRWVQAEPKTKDGAIQRIRVGFKSGPQGPVLAALEFTDSFGQTSRMAFSHVQTQGAQGGAGVSPPPERFSFTPPAGASVIRQ